MKDNQLFNGALIFFLVILGGLIFSAFTKYYNAFKIDNVSLHNYATQEKHLIGYYDFLHYYYNNNDDVMILDIRSADLFSIGHLKNAENMPKAELMQNAPTKKLKRHKGKIIIYSDYEHKSVLATLLLRSGGLNNVYALVGDFNTLNNNLIDSFNKSYLFYKADKAKWNYPNIIKSKHKSDHNDIPKPEPVTIQGGC